LAEELGFNTEYRVTARKWRPRVFSDVTSQDFITKTLKNAIKNNRISHAYLFSGPRGVGKTTVARILAKSLNCLNPGKDGDPCNVCESCKEIDNDNRNHPDVFEIDGASNRNIEDVRELKEKVKYGPIRSRYKIFIIDEVHMLTGASFNALLKTLEEPPSYVVFMFATTAPEKVPLTILGRCQKFDFKRLTIDEIKSRIKYIADEEKIKIDEESLFFISKKGDGSLRDAQGLFDMSASYCNNDITFDKLKEFFNLAESDIYFNITEYIKAKDGQGLLNYFDDLMNRGYDMQTFLDGLTEHYRNLLIVTSTNSIGLIMETESVRQKYQNSIGRYTQIEIINSLKLILQTEFTFKYSSNQRTLIEALLVELIKFTDTKEISQIVEELKELKSDSKKKTFSELRDEEDEPSRPESTDSPKPDSTYDKVEIKSKSENSMPAETSQTSTINDPQNQWVAIVDSIKAEKRWVYSLLKDAQLEGGDNGNYTIKVADQRYDSLTDYKDYLAQKISGFFGKQVRLSLARYIQNPGSAADPHYKNEIQEEDNAKRIESILKNELNAKEINPYE
jgi:DNA polymerase-3 subunit gamma/tau